MLRSAQSVIGSVSIGKSLRSVSSSPDGILIVDDQTLFAEALSLALDKHGFVVLGIARSSAETLRLAAACRPGLVLVNLGLRNLDGIRLGERILARFPGVRLVGVVPSELPESAADAARAGFDGCVLRNTPLRHFISTIRVSLAADAAEARVAGPRLDSNDRHAALLVKQLTRRELQILSLLAEGQSGDDIGRALSISPNTVRTHIGNVLTKLQVHSRLEAVAFAVRHRVVPGPGAVPATSRRPTGRRGDAAVAGGRPRTAVS
jgi:DNA-binding NarL/FixJ family response regulator